MRPRVTSLFATFAVTSAVAMLTLTLAPTQVHAQTYFSNLTSLNLVAPMTTVYDFEGITEPGIVTNNAAVVTVSAPGRVTFSISGGADALSIYAFDSEFDAGIWSLNGTDSIAAGFTSNVSQATTVISLDDLYTAFSVEIGQTNRISNNYTIGLYNGNTQIGTDFVTGGVGGSYFYGVTSDIAFNNVRVRTMESHMEYTVFDNVRTGSISNSAVPEANTLALVLPVLGMAGAVMRRRKK